MLLALPHDHRRRSIVSAVRAVRIALGLAAATVLITAVTERARADSCCICQGAETDACVFNFFPSCASCEAACNDFDGTMLACCETPDGTGCASVTGCLSTGLCLEKDSSPTGFCTGPCLVSPTPTPTVTETPTATPTNTPIPQGGACTTPAQCSTNFCVDGVCCDTACPEPLQCNVPGQVGTCGRAPAAPAPALTPTALLLALVVLAGLAAIALRRRHVGRHGNRVA